MEQLIFVAIILFFSILEAISRKGRERRGAGPPSQGEWPMPAEPRQVPEAQRVPQTAPPATPEALPTYDEEPSFDDRVEAGSGRRAQRAPQGSEGMVPADVWEEILALARGGGSRRAPSAGQSRTPPAPPRGPVPGRTAPPARRPVQAPAPMMPRSLPEPVHPVHLTHPKMGTPMQGRLTEAAARVSAPVNRDARAVLRMISGGRGSLRQAVLLAEILGIPAALREDPYDPDLRSSTSPRGPSS